LERGKEEIGPFRSVRRMDGVRGNREADGLMAALPQADFHGSDLPEPRLGTL